MLPLLLLLASPNHYLVHAGKFVDVERSKVRTKVSIVVQDGRFKKVSAGYAPLAPGQTLLDLKNHTVLPGLMDMHTHISFELSKKSYSERFFMDPADVALRASVYARRTLEAGFTTVRDLGDRDNVTISLKRAIAKRWVVGPRIFTAAKSIATTGGHADPTNGLNQALRKDPGPKEGVINGPDDARKAVRQRYKDGADLIKLTATGGVLSLAASGQNPQFTREELVAVVQTAKDYGFTVAVHAHGAEGMKRAVLAGVTSIEHGTYMTREIIALMKSRGTYYVPTISAGKWVGELAQKKGYFPAVVQPKAARIGPVIQATFQKAYRGGVKIAFGTDSGVSPHGDNAKEFVYMVEAGMPAMTAIRSATVEAAKLLKVYDRLGSITAGKEADLIAVSENPVDNIAALQKVTLVMKAGEIFRDLR